MAPIPDDDLLTRRADRKSNLRSKHRSSLNQAEDIAVNTPAGVGVHLNNLLGEEIGVNNLGSGTVNAVANWWGYSGGPETEACSNLGGPGVVFTPWLHQPIQ
jgi:hypothetical protein